MKVKEESKNVGLKLNIQKTKIMASGPITSWEIDGDGIDGSRFTVKANGGNDVFDSPELNRAVIIEKQ